MSTSPIPSAVTPLMPGSDAWLPETRPVAETGLVHIAPGLLGKTSRRRSLLFWSVGLMGFLAVILVVLHLGSLQKMTALIGSAHPGWMLVALAVQSCTYVSAAFVWHKGLQLAIFVFVFDALTLWLAFNAIGEVPPLWVVFVSFIIASMVATIGPIPVGLGTFEATARGC